MGISAGIPDITAQPTPSVLTSGLVVSEEGMLPRFLNARDEYGQWVIVH